MDRDDLRAFFHDMGEKPFRADQVMKWMYHELNDDFAEMTNLSKALREKMATIAEIRVPDIVTEQHSHDGTHKWLLRMDGSNAIETVYIPEAERGTLCISSQVGCALDCTFCATAQQGFNRNLSVAEIIGQVWMAARELGQEKNDRAVTNIVFMGMGEPLANYKFVVKAISILLDDFGFGLSKRRVTVSTSGIVPAMERLKQDVDVSLAVSLHAPNDELRDEIVPINQKYPIADLMEACVNYVSGQNHRTRITFEYVMLSGVNDTPQHAHQLARLLKDVPCKVNLIPFNPFTGTDYQRSSPEAIDRFRKILLAKHVFTTTRRTRGDDIDAACGQLAGKVKDRTKRTLKDIPIQTGVSADSTQSEWQGQ